MYENEIRKVLDQSPTIHSNASDLLDRVVDGDAKRLADGLDKFTDEQVRQAQVMSRRDMVLLASYLKDNTALSLSIEKTLKLQNKLIACLVLISLAALLLPLIK